jgi:hypothetical protein
MGMELLDRVVAFSPGPADVHCHPRVFAPLNMYTREDGLTVPIGKAGLEVYTETMLRSGLTHMGAMSNEFLYVRTAEDPDVVVLKQFPISTPDRATMVALSGVDIGNCLSTTTSGSSAVRTYKNSFDIAPICVKPERSIVSV